MRFKQHVIGVIMMFICQVTFAQIGVRPDHFTEQTNPTNENFEVYSQKNGLPRRASLNNFRKVMLPQVNPVPVAFFPMTSGNLTNLGQFVTDPAGALWYIDGQGRALNFGEALIDYVADSIQVSLVDSMIYIPDTLYLYVGDTVFKTEIIAGGGGGGSSNWTDLGGIIHPAEGDTVNIPDDFPFGPPGTGNLNLTGRFDPRYPESGSTTIAIGRNTLKNLTTGIENLALGTDALELNTTGSWNLGIGLGTLGLNSIGNSNVAIGIGALTGNSAGNNNVGVGNLAMIWNSFGHNNVAIGTNAGEYVSGDGNIMVGHNAGMNNLSSNKLYIDNTSTDDPLIYGDMMEDSLRINGYLAYTQNGGSPSKIAGRDGYYFTDINIGEGLLLEDGALGVSGSGSDSLFEIPDSLCFIIMGDTSCHSLDSVIYYETEVCFWEMGDTTCIPFGNEGINVYNSNGAIIGSRVVTVPAGMAFTFRRTEETGTQSTALQINASSSTTSSVTMALSSPSTTRSILNLQNPNTSGDIFMHWNGAILPPDIWDYTIGLDKSRHTFTIAEGSDLSDPFLDFNGKGDSIVVVKDIQIDAQLLDEDGDAPTIGDVLTGTATGVDWAAPSAGGGAISDLTAATATNDIDNVAYQQDWRWNSLAGGSGLKISSNSTLATGDNQKLFEASLSGANANSGQDTYAGYFANTHSGTSSTNYAVYGNATNSSTSYGVYGIGNTAGVYGSSSAGSAIFGNSGNGFAIYGLSTNATAIVGQSTNGFGAQIVTNPTGTNNVDINTRLQRNTSGTASNNIGTSIEYVLECVSGSSFRSNQIKSLWSNATDASRTSSFVIEGVNNATAQDIITIEGSGLLKLNQYTTSNHNGGTAADSVLTISSTGEVKKRNAAAFGGGGGGVTDHGALTGLGDDDHPHYVDETSTESIGGAKTFTGSIVLPVSAAYAPTADGSVGYDNTQDKYVGGGAGGLTGSFPRVLVVGHPASSLINSTTADQDFTSLFTIPANYLTENKVLRVTMIIQTVTGVSTATLGMYLKIGSTKVAATGTINMDNSTTRSSTLSFIIHGTSAPSGASNIESGVSSAFPTNNTANNTVAQPQSVATNGTLAITPGVSWSATGSTEEVQVRTFLIEELN